jgi:NitT/TauT family transport system substrate-binding protein
MDGQVGRGRACLRQMVQAPGMLALVVVLGCSGPAPASAPGRAAAPSATGPAAQTARSDGGSTVAAAAAVAPAPPVRVRVAYSEVTAGQTVNWVTYEAGFYAKHGLDVDLQYVSSSQTIAAAMAGEVEISHGGGYAVINSRLAGSDLVIFLGGTNWYPYELMVVPEIGGAADLRGKTVGVSRFGSSSDVATRVALRQLGLEPERDVTLIQTGAMQERVAAMQAGAIVGGVVSPPETTVLRRMGLKTVLDMRTIAEEEMTTQVYATASYLRANEAAAQAFVNAQIEGLHYARTNREHAERVLGQYLKLDDPEALADAYNHYVGQREDMTLRPAVEAARKYLQGLAATDDRVAGVRLEDAVDLRFVERAVSSGFVDRLWGRQ